MCAHSEARPDATAAITGAVLAGGASHRMGRDKRSVEVGGVPLLRRVVGAVAAVSDEVLVVTRHDRPVDPAHLVGLPPVRVVHDRHEAGGPLAGIEAALSAASHDLVLVVATDHPWLAPPVLSRLVAELSARRDVDVVALQASDESHPEPLLAAYRRRVGATASGLLDSGERRAQRLLASVRTRALAAADWRALDPAGRTATNVNRPSDLDEMHARPSDSARSDPGRADDGQAPGDARPRPPASGLSAFRGAPAPAHDRTRRGEVLTVRGARRERRPDVLAGEEPMQILAAGRGQEPVPIAVTMRTPGHEAELAVGFMHSEGLLAPGDVDDVTFGDPVVAARPDDTVTVRLHGRFDAASVADRSFVATASCGICGRASLDGLDASCPTLSPGPTLTASVLTTLPDQLRAAQGLFDSTGGLHAAGLFSAGGEPVCVREDVGRHNALDKVVGAQLLAGALPLHDHVLLVSGRVSFELVQKAAVAGIPIVAAVSAPSDLAVSAAERCGMTLVGFLRGDGFNCYTRPDRLDLDA